MNQEKLLSFMLSFQVMWCVSFLSGCKNESVSFADNQTVAREWNEQILEAIRKDKPAPTIHARNLFHLSAAMYDAWAAYDAKATGYLVREKLSAESVANARREAISYAAYRILMSRYKNSPSANATQSSLKQLMVKKGFDVEDTTTSGNTPRALGNRIAEAYIQYGLNDGSNEANGYADTTGAAELLKVNPILEVAAAGTGELTNPDRWQPLKIQGATTQNGMAAPSTQGYVGPHWKNVKPFAMQRESDGELYHNPGAPPAISDPKMNEWVVSVIKKSSQLNDEDETVVDISPGTFGNNSLGADDGKGHSVNPVTGAAYASQKVKIGNFSRVLTEFWADGPHSETPPGHWNVLANEVRDNSAFERRWRGQGNPLDILEWDVKTYFALNGAVHDAAITAWEVKRAFLCTRPISLIRYKGGLGQSSDPALPSYHPNGLPLISGLIELITTESTAPGQRHESLAGHEGELAIHVWPGQPATPALEDGGVKWKRAVEWIPYQEKTFVTPAFPGFISGHSTFSRSAAEVLAAVTGSEFFPGGLKEFVARKNSSLRVEKGPSEEVRLQWATYYDAADQAGQSRLWGGIHIQPDDYVGRRLGHDVGVAATSHAEKYFNGIVP